MSNGYEGQIFVQAMNRFMAWEAFNEIAKDFEDKVVAADCYLSE